ncbi:MAG TPA: response regulator transcription factor [Candidatus Obscuribacterales bacterium]
MWKVLTVEDVPALRKHAQEVIRNVLSPETQIVEAVNGVEGLKLALSLKPDLILMDISMPEMSGIKAAQQIWADCPSRKILFWSQYHREAYVRELGKIVPDEAIHGYALKSEDDDKLAYAIRSIVLEDNPYIDPLVRGVQVRLQSRDSSLSDVEYETLIDIAVGLTDKAIAQRRHISVRGVQNRLSMLLEKLVKGEDAHLRESAGMEVFNPRTRVVFEALKRGLFDPDDLKTLESDLAEWLGTEFDYERL